MTAAPITARMGEITTEFHRLPMAFLEAYQRDLLTWAAEFGRIGPRLRVRLLRAPLTGSLDIAALQETIELMAELYRHPVSGERRIVIGPASDFEVEIVELHVQDLPRILMAREIAAKAWAARGEVVRAVFEGVPVAVVEHYDAQFKTWGAEIAKRGRRCAIPFDVGPGEKPRVDADGNPIWRGAWFEAELDWSDAARPRLVIRPADEATLELLERHAAEIAGWRR